MSSRKRKKQTPDSRLKCVPGPFGCYQHDERGVVRIGLTDEGRAELERWLVKYPKPVSVLKSKAWRVYETALDVGLGLDEVEQLCFEGAVLAMGRFNPAVTAEFCTYAGWWMRGAVDKAIYKHCPYFKHGFQISSLNRPATQGGSNDSVMTVEDLLAAKGGSEVDTLEVAMVRESLAKALPDPKYRQIVAAIYGLDGRGGRTMREVGAELGLTTSRVQQINAISLKRLTDHLRHLVAA
jgi:RNA polymerase sigma factor (sigma-70 family)